MDLGFLTAGLLTGLREGVEAALIISIVLAYLAKTGNTRHFGKIWIGTGAALAVSAAAGVLLLLTIGGMEEPGEQIWEGIAMVLAASVVTWMLFWMRREGGRVKSGLHERVDRVLSEGTLWGLTVLAFTAVIREGIETSLFLLGQITAASRADTGALPTLLGALIGLAIAAALGYGFYRGARIVNLRTFFTWTGIALIFIAAGLLSSAVHEFIEVGAFYGITVPLSATAFDISALLPHEDNIVGQLLAALFGYTSRPEWLTFLVWLGYLATVLWLYTRPVRPGTAERPEVQREIAGA